MFTGFDTAGLLPIGQFDIVNGIVLIVLVVIVIGLSRIIYLAQIKARRSKAIGRAAFLFLVVLLASSVLLVEQQLFGVVAVVGGL